ncbi:MAG: efflux RND transporter periplasmic adaptor subunit [Calditrichaeota bacterium]|nr:MAG: efflux RND transporter periplasmic adaptor subunit [Calditrichota bacterium]
MDRKIEKKKWPPKKIAMLAFSGLFFVVLVYNIGFGDRTSKLNVDQRKITISPVTRGPFREFIPVTGTVLPIKTIYLDAVEAGRVDTVFIEAGSFVNRGDKILQLENRTLHIQISSQDAQVVEQRNLLTSTRFNLEQNRITLRQRLIDQAYQIRRLKRLFDRRKELFARKLISEEEFLDTKDEYEYQLQRQELNIESFKQDSIFQEVQMKQLENSLARLEQNLQIARKRLDDLTIRAPISGQLTSLNAEVGQSISQGQRIGQIDKLDGFKVRAGIDEHYLVRIQKGAQGEFDFAGKNYKLVVQKIYPEVRNGRFEVDLEFVGEAPEGIRRGQTLHVRLFLGGLSEAVLIPRGGFYQKTGGQWIYVVDESGAFAVKRKIRLGRQNTQMFEVLDGLTPGERVITSSYDSFGDIEKLILKH